MSSLSSPSVSGSPSYKRGRKRRSQSSLQPRTREQRLRDADEKIRSLSFGTFKNEMEFLEKLKEAKLEKKQILEEMVADKKRLEFKGADETDQLVEKWREACQEILQDFHKRAVELGMTPQSFGGGRRRGSLYYNEESTAKRRRNLEEDEEDNDSMLTMKRMLQLLGIDPALVRYDEEEEDFIT